MKTPATASEPKPCPECGYGWGEHRDGCAAMRPKPDSASVGKEPKRVGPPSLLADEIAREKAAATPSGGGKWTVDGNVLYMGNKRGIGLHNEQVSNMIAAAHNQSLSETGRGEQPRDCGEVFKLLAEIRDLMPEWSMKDLRDRIDAAMKSQTGKP